MKIVFRLMGYLNRYRTQAIVTYLCLLVFVGLNLLVPWLIKQVIDQGLSQGDRAFMLNAGLLIFGVALARGLVGFGRFYLIEWLGQRVAYDLRNELYDKYQRLSFAFHDKAHTGDLMSRATSDVDQVQRFVSNGLLDLVMVSLTLLSIFVIMLIANLRLALITLMPIPVLIFWTVRFGLNQRTIS